jgi:hypothetical protein
MMTAESNYEYVDEVVTKLKALIPRWLNNSRLRLSTFDEVNVLSVKKQITEEYEKISNQATQGYFQIAKRTYREAYEYAKILGYKDGTYNPIWLGIITDWLLEYDEVTGYVFSNELERKRDRLIERILSLALKGKLMNSPEVLSAFKQASKYINAQVTEYGNIVAHKAMIKAYEDAGVERVVWLSEYDNRVCDTCLSYSGFEFDINKVPPRPHWGCRCWLLPI